jgi:ABC-2 type transport system permease protein
MRAYAAVLSAGFRRQATYRLAAVSGLATNAFWGVVKTALFLALYRDRGEVGGLVLSEALTYTWVSEALFAVAFTPWSQEFGHQVRSGAFSVELTRPGDPYLRLLAFDLGRNLNQMLLRSFVPLAVAAALLPLDLPSTPAAMLLFAFSVLLAAAASFELRFLMLAWAFWTPDWRYLFNLEFALLWLVSGFVIPTDYFPPALRAVADATPAYALVMAPFDVAAGRDAGAALAAQAVWVLLLALAGRGVMAAAERRLVVHGG